MDFGTFYFFQAAPGQRHADIIRRELEQIEWTEELGFDEIWLTEHHFIDYGLSVDPATLAHTQLLRGEFWRRRHDRCGTIRFCGSRRDRGNRTAPAPQCRNY